ncbi:aldehyde dehydrogenase family protein [Kineococcus aurantiacus]|uniref:Succinate-semialdehyde dehydrogenase/glutarate-semialdehyde dehydrogenase n=1 Tax=Kineococcus aurantiacus TaxID=37633 RepID=A0A7Y9AUI8_9ACTN|nr:succinate-semialdehyde dehydrogenase/glutarate-semialdehyde dehydrogenase [Kineococcus aurantiacus]
MSTTPAQQVVQTVPSGLFIGGHWREGRREHRIDVENPATGEVLTTVADADETDGREALDAAVAAQASWARTPSRERAEVLRRAFDLLTARADEFALLMTLEMGKPLAEARGEVTYGAEFLRWFSEEAPRISGRYAPNPVGGSRLLTTKAPVGPTLMITPWNFPLAMATRKVAPAVAAGCTMVVKPATATPLTMLKFAELMSEAGLPDGVLNVVTTSTTGRVTAPLLADPRLRKLTFTGSTEVGRKLIAASADQVLRVSMELGGNAPFLVFDDADLDRAVEGALAAKMRNTGEACTAANRFYVQRGVAAEFTERFADRLGNLVVGDGVEPGTQVGPLIDAGARADVAARVDEAVLAGGKVLTGGAPVGDRGYFYAPTLVTDVPAGARLLTEETFGPVAPVVVFDTEDEALTLANATEFGLIAYAFTRDLDRGLRVAEALETGMVGLNAGVVSNAAAPFGGVKASGYGREGGFEGIEEYLETKYVGIG